MKWIVIGFVVLLLCAVLFYIAIPLYLGNKKANSEDPTVWQDDIDKFRNNDSEQGIPLNPIVLAGSSSIRLWDGMPATIGGLPVLNRGFGGAKIADVDFYINDLLIKYNPKMVVMYLGAIDLYIYPESAQQSIIDRYIALCGKIRKLLPDAKLALIALRPSPYRSTKYAAFNEALKNLSLKDENIYFIDANDAVADEKGTPRKDLYGWDFQHLNKKGYQLWGTQLVKRMSEIVPEN